MVGCSVKLLSACLNLEDFRNHLRIQESGGARLVGARYRRCSGAQSARESKEVKTTSPKKYCVRPNVGVIMPKSICDFTVTMQAQREAPPDMICNKKS
ncbi:Major sperm protein [Corchorus olitorius]|uniref:Major sperm protein n=1 Tax=Corchorus olitorius TaxID=93759 RepID=A0A1R3I4G6_9ROSI|nr:Major sperm protein [Corchorus olitorius]